MALRTIFADLLADLIAAQPTDHARTHDQGNEQRGQNPQNPSQRQILKDIEARVEIFG